MSIFYIVNNVPPFEINFPPSTEMNVHQEEVHKYRFKYTGTHYYVLTHLHFLPPNPFYHLYPRAPLQKSPLISCCKHLEPGGDPLVHLEILLGTVQGTVALRVGHLDTVIQWVLFELAIQ